MPFALAAGIVAVQALTGAIWWLAARPRRSALETLGMGIALGTFAAMASGVLLHGTAASRVSWALPTALTLIALAALPSLRVRARAALRSLAWPRPELAGAAMALAAGGAVTAVNWARVPLDAITDRSFTDLYFLEAITRGFTALGPGQSPLMAGGEIRYHWFAYAWAGQVADAASLPSFGALTRILPVTALLGLALLAVSWSAALARRLGVERRWVPALAGLLVTFGGYAGALYGSILNFDSPSQSLTTVWLLALGIAATAWLIDGGIGTLAGALAMAVACTGGKVSHAAVGAVGLAAASLPSLVRGPRMRPLALLAGSAVAMVLTFVGVISGAAADRNLVENVAVRASTWQQLDPVVGPWGPVLGTGALLLAALARVSGMGLLDRAGWRDPAVLFAAGGLAVGIAALLGLSEGVNETWFLLAASAAGAVASSVGIAAGFTRVGGALGGSARARLLPPTVIAVGAAASLVSVVLASGAVPWSNDAAPNLPYWGAAVAPWLIAAAGGCSAALLFARHGSLRFAIRVAALTAIGSLVVSSIVTRPATAWTASRTIQTEVGAVAPDPGVGTAAGEGAGQARSGDPRAAAAWLAARARPGDVVLVLADPASALVPALTGVPAYLAARRYQVGLGRANELAEIDRRDAVVTRIANGETSATCQVGARWAWAPSGLLQGPGYDDGSFAVVDLASACG